MNNTQIIRARRARFHSQGLTARGFEPVNSKHLELAGLSGSKYHTAYMLKQRSNDKRAWRKMSIT